jgi:hypothetical protein
MRKSILFSVFLIIIIFTGFSFVQAEILDDNKYVNEYISRDNLDRSDSFLLKITAPQVVYSVLATFAMLTVVTTYFVVVGILFIIFFSTYK